MGSVDLTERTKKNKGITYVLAAICTFNKTVWTVPLKNKKAQKTKYSPEKVFAPMKMEPIANECEHGKEFVSKMFRGFLETKETEKNVATFERGCSHRNFSKTIRNLRRDLFWNKHKAVV